MSMTAAASRPRPTLLLAGLLASMLVALLVALASTRAAPPVHEVRMVNVAEHGRFVYDPPLLFIEPGDAVRFVAVDAGHASQTIPGMVPEGGPTWRTSISRDTEVTFDVEGVYGFRCRAHYTVGMVGLIVVGDPSANLDDARKVMHPERPQRILDQLFAEIEARQR